MASQLFRSVSKTNQLIIRPNSLTKLQKRNSGTNINNESVKDINNRVPSTSSSGAVLPLAVGLSLGLGVSLFVQTNIMNKFFPEKESKPEKPIPTLDPKIIDELISLSRKTTQLENQLQNVRQEVRETQNQQATAQTQAPSTPRSNVDIFELSQVIEANNLANLNTRRRELDEQRKALGLDYSLRLEGEILKVENKYRPVINKIKELESHLETQYQNHQKEAPAKILWISCQALLDRMRNSNQGPIELDPAYNVLKQFAANNNQLAISVLDAIPAKALKQGVESEESLIDRFSKVETVCKRVALVNERGGGLGKYFVSYLQSLFIIDSVKITEDELAGRQLIDPTVWSTFDILARVKCCLQRHNLDLATRYANQLRGQARVVARDWIRDARTHLEVKEAFSVLSTYAEAVAVDSVNQNPIFYL